MARSSEAATATLASTVYRRLRADVLSGVLAPGAPLRTQKLRQNYGAGLSPLREALNRLVAEKLVAQVDQRGFRVAPANVDDLHELTTARIWITAIALREAIPRGDAIWEEQILLAFHRMIRATRRNEPLPDLNRLHKEFHATLLAPCGSRWITDYADTLFDNARRYQSLTIQTPSRPRDIEGEHRAIMDAVLARDVDLAVRLHTEHIARTEKIVVAMKIFPKSDGAPNKSKARKSRNP